MGASGSLMQKYKRIDSYINSVGNKEFKHSEFDCAIFCSHIFFIKTGIDIYKNLRPYNYTDDWEGYEVLEKVEGVSDLKQFFGKYLREKELKTASPFDIVIVDNLLTHETGGVVSRERTFSYHIGRTGLFRIPSHRWTNLYGEHYD